MRVTVEGSPTGLASLAGEFPQLRNYRSQHLEDDGCGDVRIDTHRGDAKLA